MYIFKESKGTYNPQKTEGKPYTCIEGQKNKNDIYGINNEKKAITINKGDRHPSSIIEKNYEGETILEFNNPAKPIHRTQKPVDLIEWLIKSYSNEKDVICDFTFGSGSTPIACLNTNRHFIGCERDKDIFNNAEDRIIKLFEV